MLVFTLQCGLLFLGAFGSNRTQPKTRQKGAAFSHDTCDIARNIILLLIHLHTRKMPFHTFAFT